MTTRAAINILGSTGEIINISSLGNRDIASEKSSVGKYIISGTLGMVPAPDGWGHVVNQLDNDAVVIIGFDGEKLVVDVSRNGEPSDLAHSITLHVVVPSWAPPMPDLPVEPDPAPDPLAVAQATQAQLRAYADYVIAPLQDVVELGEATEAEAALLMDWKRYRVALSRLPDQEGYPNEINWPASPA